MADGHGGARPGAGRKSKAEKYETEIAQAERRIADRLPDRLDTLEELAEGGYEKRTRKFEPAGLVMIEEVLRDGSGRPYFDDFGNPLKGKVRAFPELKPDELVCVEEIREQLAPDRAANVYLMDRILGRPTQAVEHTGADGGPIVNIHDPRLLSDTELDALESLLAKATPADGDPGTLSNGDPDTRRGEGGEVPA